MKKPVARLLSTLCLLAVVLGVIYALDGYPFWARMLVVGLSVLVASPLIDACFRRWEQE